MNKTRAFLDWECHRNTFTSVFINTILNMSPIAAAVIFGIFNKWKGWNTFWVNGEFYLYSAVFLASSIFTIINITTVTKSNMLKIAMVISILFMGVSWLAYGSIVTSNIVGDGTKPEPEFLKFSSISLLLISLMIYYLITYWNNYQNKIADNVESKEGIEDIKNTLK